MILNLPEQKVAHTSHSTSLMLVSNNISIKIAMLCVNLYVPFPVADTPTPSPVVAEDGGLFSPSMASSPKSVSAM